MPAVYPLFSQIQSISSDFTDLTVQQLANLIVDLDRLCQEVKYIYQSEIERRAVGQGFRPASLLRSEYLAVF